MIEEVGVVGAGVMGAGIAQVLAVAGYRVVCSDVSEQAVAGAREELRTGRYGLARAVERGKLTRAAAAAAERRLEFTTALDDAAQADLVVEAVPEDLALKVHVFRELDRLSPARTILASNTSGFPIAALAASTDRPDRVLGWHWASPAVVMRLAEIVRLAGTRPDVVEAVREVARRCGKNPVVVNDQPRAWGFVTNRIYRVVVAEARQIVAEGVASADDVDQLVCDCFNWPAGPFGVAEGAAAGWSR